MRIHVVVPWLASQKDRQLSLAPLISCVLSEIACSRLQGSLVHVVVNDARDSFDRPGFLSAVNCFPSVLCSVIRERGKHAALKFGASFADQDGADALIVMDNDIVIRPGSLAQLVESFLRSESGIATAMKAPLISADSTLFQRQYSYAVTQSFLYGILPKRPTGSFYAIEPGALFDLSLDGSEGMKLDRLGGTSSGVVVLSPYSETFGDEVRRRRRHHVISLRSGLERLHSDQDFIYEATQIQLPPKVDPDRWRQSLALWASVQATARGVARETL